MTVLFLAPLFKDPQHCVYRVMWEESFANEIDMILKLISRDWFHCYSNKTFSYSNMSSPLLKGNSWLVGWSLWHTAEHNRWSNKHFVVIVFLYSSFHLLCATSSHNNLAWLFKMLWSITHPSEDSVMIILLGHIAHMHRWYLARQNNCFVSVRLFKFPLRKFWLDKMKVWYLISANKCFHTAYYKLNTRLANEHYSSEAQWKQ